MSVVTCRWQLNAWVENVHGRLEEADKTAVDFSEAVAADLAGLDTYMQSASSSHVSHRSPTCLLSLSIAPLASLACSCTLSSLSPCNLSRCWRQCFVPCGRVAIVSSGRNAYRAVLCVLGQLTMVEKHKTAVGDFLQAEKVAVAAAAERLQEDIRTQVERMVRTGGIGLLSVRGCVEGGRGGWEREHSCLLV